MSLTLNPPLSKLLSKPKPKPKPLTITCCSPSPSPSPPSSSPNSSSSFPPFSLLQSLTAWSDSIKERRVLAKRALYSASDWRAHRSSGRHLRHLLTSLSSRVILSLVPPVLSLTAFASALALYNTAVELSWLHSEIVGFPLLRASSLPYQLTAPALALLLVFRTEASYSRFQEGRKIWMTVIAGAGELASLAINVKRSDWDLNEEEIRIRRELVNYIVAFPIVLKCHVVSGSDLRADLENLLEEEDICVIMRSKHRPRCIIEFISQCLHALRLEEQKQIMMESKISCFHEGISVCEQLIGIPIPLSYTRLTSRFLVLWHLTLPIILWDDCNWIVVPATFISAASLFCIEEVGVLIEEPFPMLALDELCKQLHESIKDTISIQNSVHRRILAKTKKGVDKREFIDGRLNNTF